jgi:hypothetical protein
MGTVDFSYPLFNAKAAEVPQKAQRKELVRGYVTHLTFLQ